MLNALNDYKYKISEYTWVPWDGDCDTCDNRCSRTDTNCIPYCGDCAIFGDFQICSYCEAQLNPIIPGRMYFKQKGRESI